MIQVAMDRAVMVGPVSIPANLKRVQHAASKADIKMPKRFKKSKIDRGKSEGDDVT